MADAFKTWGDDLFRDDRYDEAASAYLSALKLGPSDALRSILHANLAAVRLEQRDWDGSLQHATNSVGLDGSNAKAHLCMGVALTSLGRPADAVASLTTALHLDPTNGGVLAALGKAEIRLHLTKDLEPASETGPVFAAPGSVTAAASHNTAFSTFDCCGYCRIHARPTVSALPLVLLYLADHFYGSVADDIFPSEETERVFGIRMESDLGTLVFGCWQRLLCSDGIVAASFGSTSAYTCPAAVAAAIHAGTLPTMFERAVRELARKPESGLERLVAWGLAFIPWDLPFLKQLAQTDHSVPMDVPNYQPRWKPFAAVFGAAATAACLPHTSSSGASGATATVPCAPSNSSSTSVHAVRFMFGTGVGGHCEQVELAPGASILRAGVASPVLALCHVPIVMCRLRPRDFRNNQAATFFMIDPMTGFAPPAWQCDIGEVVAFRTDSRPITSRHFYALWEYFSVLLDSYGELPPATVRRRYMSPPLFREFMAEHAPGVEW